MMRTLFLSLCGLLLLVLPAQAQSLLNGATASSYPTPAGWIVKWVQGCEGTYDAARELIRATTSTGANVEGLAACTTTRPHTGSKSIEGVMNRNSATSKWGGQGGPLGIGREAYISWWEWLDSNGTMNTEMFIAHTIKRDLGGTFGFHEVFLDWFNDPTGLFNSTVGQPVCVQQGNPPTKSTYLAVDTVPWGVWTQWEVHFRMNDPGVVNGFIKAYKNGVLWRQCVNMNLNGTIDMTGMSVTAGGTYTKTIWTLPDGSCSAYQGQGTETSNCDDFNNCACPPNPPIFKRHIDDVILLLPSGSGDIQPPTTPTGLAVQ